MASGDTKTEALLNILGNGGDASDYKGCCNTKTQSYILDAIDRVQNVEDEVEEIKNNPDVVDIVDTYADLQAYDKSTLTDKDIIRVLEDSTHSNKSTYYRYSASTDSFTYIGEAGGGVNVVQTTGSSTTDVMSQNATTLMVYKSVSKQAIQIGDSASANGTNSIAIGQRAGASDPQGIAIGYGTSASHGSSVAIGRNAATTRAGEMNIGTGVYNNGYNSTKYRVLGGVHDPVDAHDAATKGYVDANAGSLILYAKTSDIVHENQMSFYSDAAFTTQVTIGDIYNAAFNGKDIKIISKYVTEDDFDIRKTYNVYKSYYPKVCTDESMDECGFALYIIGDYGTNIKRAIVFQTFLGPIYYEFGVSIEDIS